jgi:hypothetical protein
LSTARRAFSAAASVAASVLVSVAVICMHQVRAGARG